MGSRPVSPTVVCLQSCYSSEAYYQVPYRTLLKSRLDAVSGALSDTVSLDVPVSNFDRSAELDGSWK